MTLHEAIQQVLLKANKALTAKDIAEILNANTWYSKKDGSKIASSQIGARVKNYPLLFNKTNGLISLKSKTGIIPEKTIIKQKRVTVDSLKSDSNLLMKVLMNEKNFKSVSNSEHLIPDQPGLYSIRIKNKMILDNVFSNVLTERNHNIMYIGLASKSLQKRFLNQELRAKGHGTFFRSLGAVLGYIPEKGSLIGKSNQNNYKFSKKDEIKIIDWINENLLINWVTLSENLSEIENKLLKEYFPLLNIAGNPEALKEVRDLRNKCKEIAIGTL
ncbi:GIY-YIG nuclease family protein [Olleya marilimosa]|uniref:GIY-YIG nuclease family protein n=1 Tax=Olleya marilimosa TaxID=272164 RepID=UPI0030EB917F|tara:strand:- start:18620 stop:19438 length:819 start_codon:yes stop_codon:yes gene_type:complete